MSIVGCFKLPPSLQSCPYPVVHEIAVDIWPIVVGLPPDLIIEQMA